MKSAAILVGVFACIAGMVAAQFMFFWRAGASHDILSYWSSGFRTAGQNYIVFFGTQLYAMWVAAFSTLLSASREALLALAVFAVAMTWVIFTGQAARPPIRNLLVFYAILFVTLGLVNYLQLWPLGALRPNLFLYGYMIIFMFLIVVQIPASRPAANLFLICAGVYLLWHLFSPGSKLYYKNMEGHLADEGPALNRMTALWKIFPIADRSEK